MDEFNPTHTILGVPVARQPFVDGAKFGPPVYLDRRGQRVYAAGKGRKAIPIPGAAIEIATPAPAEEMAFRPEESRTERHERLAVAHRERGVRMAVPVASEAQKLRAPVFEGMAKLPLDVAATVLKAVGLPQAENPMGFAQNANGDTATLLDERTADGNRLVRVSIHHRTEGDQWLDVLVPVDGVTFELRRDEGEN